MPVRRAARDRRAAHRALRRSPVAPRDPRAPGPPVPRVHRAIQRVRRAAAPPVPPALAMREVLRAEPLARPEAKVRQAGPRRRWAAEPRVHRVHPAAVRVQVVSPALRVAPWHPQERRTVQTAAALPHKWAGPRRVRWVARARVPLVRRVVRRPPRVVKLPATRTVSRVRKARASRHSRAVPRVPAAAPAETALRTVPDRTAAAVRVHRPAHQALAMPLPGWAGATGLQAAPTVPTDLRMVPDSQQVQARRGVRAATRTAPTLAAATRRRPPATPRVAMEPTARANRVPPAQRAA